MSKRLQCVDTLGRADHDTRLFAADTTTMEESKRGHVYSKPKPPPSTAQIKSIFKITQLAGRGFRVRSKKDGQNQRETKIQVKQAQQKITALVNQSSHDDQKAKAAPLGVPTNPQSGAAVPGTHKVTTMKVHQTMTKEEAEIIVVDVLKHFSSVCNHFLEKKKKHKGKVYEEVVNNRAAEVIEIIKGMQAEREKLVKIHQKRKKFDRDIYQAKYDASMDVFDAAVKSAVTAKKKFARARRAARRRALKASQGRRTRPKSSKSTKERVHSALERKTREYVEKEEEDLNSDFSESEEEEEQTGRVQDARKGLGELQDEWRSTMQNIRNLKKKLVKYVAKDPACRDLPKAEQQTMANTLALLLLKAQDIESGEFWTDENLRRASMKQKPTIYCQGAEQWFKPKSKGWVADAYEATKWSSLGLLYSQIGLTGLRFAKESEEAVGYWATLWKACGILSSVAAMLNPRVRGVCFVRAERVWCRHTNNGRRKKARAPSCRTFDRSIFFQDPRPRHGLHRIPVRQRGDVRYHGGGPTGAGKRQKFLSQPQRDMDARAGVLHASHHARRTLLEHDGQRILHVFDRRHRRVGHGCRALLHYQQRGAPTGRRLDGQSPRDLRRHRVGQAHYPSYPAQDRGSPDAQEKSRRQLGHATGSLVVGQR